ncbi:MAG: hypothetical protein NTY88_01450 [Bacteroidetes bacterium]|nr:hypothetical protein [Bacteroidota bacterium]
MHLKKVYPYVHLIHHKSVNPTPWAAFAFHPLEAVGQVLILPIMVFAMPYIRSLFLFGAFINWR